MDKCIQTSQHLSSDENYSVGIQINKCASPLSLKEANSVVLWVSDILIFSQIFTHDENNKTRHFFFNTSQSN